ncbi:MAG: hypothetical protein ACI3X1_04075 [Eubacteriales bacterium]
MREIRSNLYIFSTFLSDFGRIITSRVREGSPDGENVFAYLGISEEEQKFWRGIQLLESCRLVMLCGNRDGRRSAVALACLSEGRGSIYLALEYFDVFDAVSFLSELPDWGVAVSDGAKGCFLSDTCEPCVDVGLDIASEIRDIMVLSDGRNSQGNEPAAEMWNLTCTAASLIGLGLKCNIKHDFDCETNVGTVFKRDFYAELIVLLAADARKHSRGRSMSVTITAQNRGASARISYERFSETPGVTEKHLEQMAQEFGIPISFSYSGGECIARVTPFACDIALQGVKQDPRLFLYNL